MNIDRTIAGSNHSPDESREGQLPALDVDSSRGKPRKAPNAFRTISEVADDLHIPQHVLRFWETKFPLIKPLKRGGGRRYYRPDDILLLRRISDLLYIQGYTIKGVQRLLREGGGKLSDEIPPPPTQEELSDGEAPDSIEPQLTMPGLLLAASASPARVATGKGTRDPAPLRVTAPAGSNSEAECQRLRALLANVLAELEAVRALLP